MEEQAAELDRSALPFLPASLARKTDADAFVVVVSNTLDFTWWLRNASSSVQWLQVEGLLSESEIWPVAARQETPVALDVIVNDPANEFPALYRLVDVSRVRDVRVSIAIRSGFLKALRLAASLQFPVRLLPGQVGEEELQELREAVDLYLYDPVVEAPVEFFHSAIAFARGLPAGDLWMVAEEDPAVFRKVDDRGELQLPSSEHGGDASEFRLKHQARLEEAGAECLDCRWKEFCGGYFKLPDPSYSCRGILDVLDRLWEAADEMSEELAEMERQESIQALT